MGDGATAKSSPSVVTAKPSTPKSPLQDHFDEFFPEKDGATAKSSPSVVTAEPSTPKSDLQKHFDNFAAHRAAYAGKRRRLGWKPSHDIPRRRDGFHHLFNGVIRESERQS